MNKDIAKTRQDLLKRWGALKQERSTWMSHWQEISSYVLPRNGRFLSSDRNRGDKRHNQIYDNTGVRALRILGAGLMAGATSPARPWFRLGSHDPALNQFQPVKIWLADVGQRMHKVFQKSNTYRALHQLYEELGAFGTAVSVVMPDYNSVIHHYPLTCGEYAVASDWKGRISTLYREFEKPVSQIVAEFGLDNCSQQIKSAYATGNLDTWIPLVHAIEPREDRDQQKRDAKNMPWASYYFELNGQQDTVLRESGFRQFPAVAPRWALAGGDIYGGSPAMEALGDIKQLQHEQLRKAQGIDYQTNPPLAVPTALKNRDVERLPGGVTFVDPAAGGGQSVRTMFDVRLDLNHLLADIQDARSRIQQAFFSDLFMMLANNVDQKMTATEVALLQEEKMLMLGPVLERLDNELLYPLIETTFLHMLEGGALPPAPEELQGMELQVEFISMLAQAQRAIGTNGMDRFVGSLGMVAQMKPDVLDKLDADAWADAYSDMLGVDPRLIVGSEKLAMVRAAREKAMAAKEQAAMMEQASTAAKNLGSTPTGSQPTALTDMMNQFSGYGSPAPQEVQ